MNNSQYYLINGRRNNKLKAAEPFQDFIITDPAQTITLAINPRL
jgi:hypothetical protein